jgi:hypothetical protein
MRSRWSPPVCAERGGAVSFNACRDPSQRPCCVPRVCPAQALASGKKGRCAPVVPARELCQRAIELANPEPEWRFLAMRVGLESLGTERAGSCDHSIQFAAMFSCANQQAVTFTAVSAPAKARPARETAQVSARVPASRALACEVPAEVPAWKVLGAALAFEVPGKVLACEVPGTVPVCKVLGAAPACGAPAEVPAFEGFVCSSTLPDGSTLFLHSASAAGNKGRSRRTSEMPAHP